VLLNKPHDVRITVLKKIETGKISDEYASRARDLGPCTRMKEGEVNISRNMEMPRGFCSWAWADIQRDVVSLAVGGDPHWIKGEGIDIVCCTDGLHPVIFKLERI
jgi:uncharacterized repeat protein (TIGR04076 family)